MKVVISGYGKMGHMIENVLKRKGIELAAASEDVCSIDPALASECICIDFTTPDAFRSNYEFLARNFKAVVVGTTGWNDISDKVIKCFEDAGTTMIYSSNYSIGVNAVFAAVERLGSVLKGYGYCPHVDETHHIHKLDAPSGTAKTLGDIVEENLGVKPEITSHRIGEVPGTHMVEFGSDVDRITLCHEAYSREGFAEGAVVAAMMSENIKGVHNFKELILK